jgi:hypothetical protein
MMLEVSDFILSQRETIKPAPDYSKDTFPLVRILTLVQEAPLNSIHRVLS